MSKKELIKEDSPYTESAFRLLFHIVNNSINSGWCPHVLTIYEGFGKRLRHLEERYSDLPKQDATEISWWKNFLSSQKAKFERQIFMPYILHILHGVPKTTEEQVGRIYNSKCELFP